MASITFEEVAEKKEKKDLELTTEIVVENIQEIYESFNINKALMIVSRNAIDLVFSSLVERDFPVYKVSFTDSADDIAEIVNSCDYRCLLVEDSVEIIENIMSVVDVSADKDAYNTAILDMGCAHGSRILFLFEKTYKDKISILYV